MSPNSLRHQVNIATSSIATAMRIGNGISIEAAREKPAKLLELYEFEACPYCRIVREVLTELDLDAMIYPCPKGGTRFRPSVSDRGGKSQFPFLVDPNTGVEMYESLDIIAYLFKTYGKRPVPLKWRFGQMQILGSQLSGLGRAFVGVRAKSSKRPDEPLKLYSFESSPFARPVRDLLCELEIPYILRSAGRTKISDWVPPMVRNAINIQGEPDQQNRVDLLSRSGGVTIPYLVDPNTGVEMGESERIIEYLKDNYAI